MREQFERRPVARMKSPAGLSVLVVDDEPEIAALIEDTLGLFGHRVKKARNGRLALDLLSQESFDLVFSDMRMPDLDGLGLHAEIAKRWPELLQRLVFITGDQASDETLAFLSRTGSRCLGKPFTLAELQDLVDQVAALPAR